MRLSSKKRIPSSKLVQIPCRTHGRVRQGPLPGAAWFVGNETLSVVQQGLNDDLDNADGEQGHKSAYRDFRAAIRIEFVEVFHNVFSPVDFELKLSLFKVRLRSPWAINVRVCVR